MYALCTRIWYIVPCKIQETRASLYYLQRERQMLVISQLFNFPSFDLLPFCVSLHITSLCLSCLLFSAVVWMGAILQQYCNSNKAKACDRSFLFLRKLKPNGTHEKLSVRVVNDLIDQVKIHPRQRENPESPFLFPFFTHKTLDTDTILRYIHHHHLTQPKYCWCRLQLDRTKWPWNFSLRLLFHRRNNLNCVQGWYYVRTPCAFWKSMLLIFSS